MTGDDSQPIVDANKLVERRLDDDLRKIETIMGLDVLVFFCPIDYAIDDDIRDLLEAREGKSDRGVAVILETTGGYIEVAQRIAETIRYHYQRVEFVVPNFAMSAGTVLAMSGDAIHMDYYSVLGPIDPQVKRPGGPGMIPALGYLVQYERMIEKSADGELTSAEMAFLIEKFDLAELYYFEQAQELTVALLKEWLAKYKFKDWKLTETRGIPVDEAMRIERAEAIAKELNNTDRWHSHSRGISMRVLREELKLKIEDFGLKPDLKASLRSYHKLQSDYIAKRRLAGIIHVPGTCITLGGE